MTDIPKARALISGVLERARYLYVQDWSDLDEALSLMTRKVKPRRSSGNVPMTNELGDRARVLHSTTRLSNAAIGKMLKVDGGRVSEAINGDWQ